MVITKKGERYELNTLKVEENRRNNTRIGNSLYHPMNICCCKNYQNYRVDSNDSIV